MVWPNDIFSHILFHKPWSSVQCAPVSGGIIALGVFGGFVFLAAIITTIVILIRR